MVHYMKLNGESVAIDCNCNHPKQNSNTCPTRLLNCDTCKYMTCRASGGVELFALLEKVMTK